MNDLYLVIFGRDQSYSCRFTLGPPGVDGQAWLDHNGAKRGEEAAVDLQTLHERTGIGKRKLRYCLDHKLIPELSIELADDEAGRPRRFADDVGFGIVCAARLLDLGLPHETIRLFLAG